MPLRQTENLPRQGTPVWRSKEHWEEQVLPWTPSEPRLASTHTQQQQLLCLFAAARQHVWHTSLLNLFVQVVKLKQENEQLRREKDEMDQESKVRQSSMHSFAAPAKMTAVDITACCFCRPSLRQWKSTSVMLSNPRRMQATRLHSWSSRTSSCGMSWLQHSKDGKIRPFPNLPTMCHTSIRSL